MYSTAEANAPNAAEVAAGGSLAVLCFVDVFIELLRDLKLQRRGSAVPFAPIAAAYGPVEASRMTPISRLATPHSIVPGECAIRFWSGTLNCRLETRSVRQILHIGCQQRMR